MEFNPLWQLSETEKGQITTTDVNSIASAFGGGLITKSCALKELKQQSHITGRFTNISSEDIEDAENEVPLSEGMFPGDPGAGGGGSDVPEGDDPNERLGGANPDVPDENEIDAEPSAEEKDVTQDSITKKVRFRDALRAKVREWLDKDFKEYQHPRGSEGTSKGGQFVKKGSGGGASAVKAKSAPKEAATKPSKSSMQPAKMIGGKRVASDGKALPKHIASAKIPPAWTDVVYNPDPKAELMVTGKAENGKLQYIYSEAHWSRVAAEKFSRIDELNEKFDAIQKENNKSKTEEALVLKLIMQTGIRPGSDEEILSKVKAYGATTLEGKHVQVKGSSVVLKFIGKKGVENNIPVKDKEMASLIIQRAKKAGPNGQLFGTDGSALLKYTHSLDGGGFKTKDFRTLLGTKVAMESIKLVDPPDNEKEYKKRVKEIAKIVAQRLGNTPSVCLKAYIHPAVFSEWRMAL
jgi:DNA topoisomerase-1